MQNATLGMTKQAYFEVCEALNSEPIESEIPVEFDDLILEAQQALQIYNNLQDSWDYMNGNYIGKNLMGFRDILEIFDVPKEDHRVMYEMIMHIDSIRAKAIRDAKPKS
jgi:hypothetical protein